MVKEHTGDIFKAPIDVLVHQANCFCCFGAGIAAVIKERFPEAYEADCKTIKGDRDKLGTISWAKVKNISSRPLCIRYVINMYSQYGFGDKDRATSYDAMVNALTSIRDGFMAIDTKARLRFGVPYGIGCGLGGGDFRIVKAILESVFGNSPLILLICRREGD